MKLDYFNQLVAFITLVWGFVGLIWLGFEISEITLFIVLSFLIAIQKTISLPKKT